jgi:Lipid A 3-O-deacylase (PagL)
MLDHRTSRARAAALLFIASLGARAGSIPSFGLAAGEYGFRKEIPHSLGIDVQVRSPWRWNVFRPVAGLLANSSGGTYLYAGILIDVPLPARLHLTPGFAPGVILSRGDGDLGSRAEFRSSLELSVSPIDALRVALAFSHISNARLTQHNPGVEVLTLGVVFPAGE